MLSAPPQRPLSTRASTSPPSAGAGSASRTATARTLPRSPAASPAFPPAVHRPAHVASCSRTPAAPHSNPATPINPIAAPTGPRRATESATLSPPPPPAPRPRSRLGLLHELNRLRTAARSQPDLAAPLQQHHVELGTLLVARERQLREHLALVRRDVMRRQAVQRVHEHVAPARVAPAEPREPAAQLLVLALRHFEC